MEDEPESTADLKNRSVRNACFKPIDRQLKCRRPEPQGRVRDKRRSLREPIVELHHCVLPALASIGAAVERFWRLTESQRVRELECAGLAAAPCAPAANGLQIIGRPRADGTSHGLLPAGGDALAFRRNPAGFQVS